MLGIIRFINLLFQIYSYLVLARVLLSWFPVDRNNPIINFIYEVTEPVLAPFRVIIPIGMMGLDLSPILAFFFLDIFRRLIIKLLIIIFY
ncbi:MAG TPA: YggT family protein [Candidatus Atribacteria bacterium]|nr:YggT family protein [Candidatus Atribacteria bacterium]